MRPLVLLLLWPVAAAAQSADVPTEFPADAAMVSAEALRDHMAGKVFRAQPAKGPGWRLEYKSNGYVFLDTTKGYRDSGQWSVEASRLCAQWQSGRGGGCSDVRLKGATVYLKRDSNGEVVAMVPD